MGGLLTVLEVLAVRKASEEDRMEALDLLIDLAKTGRQCKELICESYGIKSVAESLAQSSSPLSQQKAQHLLLLLFQVNWHSVVTLVCVEVRASQLLQACMGKEQFAGASSTAGLYVHSLANVQTCYAVKWNILYK